MSMLEDVRPTDPATFNAFAEVWAAIARIPAHAKVRLLDELAPGEQRACGAQQPWNR